MKNAVLFALVIACSVARAKTPSDWTIPPVFEIYQPTIIAFFPLTRKEAQAEENEALSDFQWYLMAVQKPLKTRGISLQQSYAESFSTRIGSVVTRFRPKDRINGYYFVAPGRPPHVEYGVMTDDQLLEDAQKFFGSQMNQSNKGARQAHNHDR